MSPNTEEAPWTRLEELLDDLLDEPDLARRAARLAEVCAADPDQGAELADWLARAGPPEEDLLDRPLAASLPDLLGCMAEGDGEELRPETIDRYRLLEVLGRGGMGVVYLAERADQQFEKRVALKLLPRGLETPEKVQRFRIERQILARLEHPGIARLLDGGVTAEGFPYLVMERIEGERLDLHCDRRGLPLRARLELFLEICEAVQFAHGNLVVHRDLKPGNILVTPAGEVKLLDFGVAEILGDGDQEAPPKNLTPLTPDYAAPEQLANRPVSTASDVYSLGVVLFRLLTGTTPAQLRRQIEEAGDGAEQRGEAEVPPPSQVPRLAAGLPPGASSTGLRLSRGARGDLDRIVLRALAAEPAQRYVSAAALADDVRRHLEGHPVAARPATRTYRFARFVSRHRVGTAIATAVVALLIAGGSTVLWQARLAARERDRARVAASRAEQVAEFVGGLFEAASPISAGAGRLSLRELLDEGEARLRGQLRSEPAVRGKLLEVMAGAYAALGDQERAVALARESLADLRRAEPGDPSALASALTTLAALRIGQGRLGEAEPALREAQVLLARSGQEGSHAMARLLRHQGILRARRGDEQRAAGLHREALDLWRARGADAEAAAELVYLAGRLDAIGRSTEGLELKLEALVSLRRIYGEAHPTVLSTRNNVAFSLHRRGRYGEAEAIYRAIQVEVESLLGPDHPDVADPLTNLGKVLMDQGRFAEAAPFVRRAASLRRRGAEPLNPARIAAEMNLASLELAMGDVDSALALYRAGLDRFRRLAGDDSLPVARCRSLLGVALHRAGDQGAAESHLRAAIARLRASDRRLDLADALAGLGAVRSDQGRPAEALELLEEGMTLRRGLLAPDHWSLAELRIARAGAMAALGRTAEAAAELSPAREALRGLSGHGWALERAARLASRLAASAGGGS